MKFVRTFGIEMLASTITALVVIFCIVFGPFPRSAPNQPARRLLDEPTRYSLDAVSFGGTTTILRWHPQPSLQPAFGEALTVTGWAIDVLAHAPAGSVRAIVDGEQTFAAPVDRPRPDVAAFLREPAFVTTGFGLVIPACALAPGTHRIAFQFATASGSAYYRSTDDVDVTVRDGPRVAAAVDVLEPSMRTAGSHRIAGWALDFRRCSPVSGIRVLVDGRPVAQASYGFLRRDVATHFGDAAYAPSGFAARWKDGTLTPGAHTLSLEASLGAPAPREPVYALRFER